MEQNSGEPDGATRGDPHGGAWLAARAIVSISEIEPLAERLGVAPENRGINELFAWLLAPVDTNHFASQTPARAAANKLALIRLREAAALSIATLLAARGELSKLQDLIATGDMPALAEGVTNPRVLGELSIEAAGIAAGYLAAISDSRAHTSNRGNLKKSTDAQERRDRIRAAAAEEIGKVKSRQQAAKRVAAKVPGLEATSIANILSDYPEWKSKKSKAA